MKNIGTKYLNLISKSSTATILTIIVLPYISYKLYEQLGELQNDLALIVIVEALTCVFIIRSSLFFPLLELLKNVVKAHRSYSTVYKYTKALEKYLALVLVTEMLLLVLLNAFEQARLCTRLYLSMNSSIIYDTNFMLMLAFALLVSLLVNFTLKITDIKVLGNIIGALFIPIFLVSIVIQAFNMVLLSATSYLKLLDQVLSIVIGAQVLTFFTSILLVMYIASTVLLLVITLVLLDHVKNTLQLYYRPIT